MSQPDDQHWTALLTADELTALLAAAELVLTQRWLLGIKVPIGEAVMRSAASKVEWLLAAVEIDAARQQRRSAKDR